MTTLALGIVLTAVALICASVAWVVVASLHFAAQQQKQLTGADVDRIFRQAEELEAAAMQTGSTEQAKLYLRQAKELRQGAGLTTR